MGDRPARQNDALALPQGSSSTGLRREGSQSSSRSGGVPSPRRHDSTKILPELSIDSSATSSASGSRSGSHISTPRLLSRRNSSKEQHTARSFISRKLSSRSKGKAREEQIEIPETVTPDGIKGEPVAMEVVETPSVSIERDPGTGRKMINQYLVLQEIGHGTHGRVRLGRDMSIEPAGDTESPGDMSPGNAYYAIKIVDRNPKNKRLMGFSRNKAKNDGANMVNENEIRKEIAIFKKVNHPNVVRMREIIDDPESSKLFMVLEYCAGGELQWKDKHSRPTLSLNETRRVFRDTLLGLEYLHHQGIIHRDIKPSNLLFSSDGTVKISDFGCSHYSEALQEASARAGPDGEGYVDDVELAKTAGSPAFFAPEMCFTGFEQDASSLGSRSPRDTPVQEIPAFTLRPPSIASEFGDPRSNQPEVYTMTPGGRTFPLKPTVSNDSGLSRRPFSERTQSTTTINRHPRHPITNAIDVWALGVTLYCLLFGKTPFDAQNEYQLMQVIPTADYDVPRYISSECLPTTNAPLEVQDCLDLLRRLLTKDPQKRISLEQAKRHPFTLEGLADPTSWLARTDPHAQSFVTVSNAEVAAVVVKSVSVRDKFRQGIKSFSQKLQILSGSRHRSRSIGEEDTEGQRTPATSGPPSTVDTHSILSPHGRNPANLRSMSRDASPLASPAPGGSFSRKFSFAHRAETPSPRRSSVQLGSPPFDSMAPEMSSRSVSSQSAQRGFIVHRSVPTAVQPDSKAPLAVDHLPRPAPRTTTSSSSLDKLRTSLDGVSAIHLQRRSSDVEVPGRQRERAPSIASSSGGFGGRLRSILSRSGSSRSRPPAATSDAEEGRLETSRVLSSSAISGSESAGRLSSDMESISTGPHGSVGGFDRHLNQRRDDGRLRRGSNLSEEVGPRIMNANSRRGSNLSEVFHRGAMGARPGVAEEEEVDWIGSTSSGDEVSDGGGDSDVYDAETPNVHSFPGHGQVASATPTLASIPDRSPGNNVLSGPTSPESSPIPLDRLALGRPPSTEPPFETKEVSQSRREEPPSSHIVDDEGLAINLSRRGRKGSLMGHRK